MGSQENSSEFVFTKAPGTNNNGKEYEISMIALHLLNFALDDRINDMLVGVNVSLYWPFDDAVIRVEYEHGPKLHLMQMKYKESKMLSKKLLLSNDNFCVDKYEKNYNEMIKKINEQKGMRPGDKKLGEGILPEDTKMYLCTRAELEFDVNKNEETISTKNGERELKIKKDGNENGILNVTGESCYMFEKCGDSCDTQSKIFYEQFRLLDRQNNIEEAIISRVEKEFGGGCNFNVTSFLNFIQDQFYTKSKSYLLTKRDVRRKIIELILNPYLVNICNPVGDFANWEVWDDMVANVNVTIMDEFNLTSEPLLNWLYSKYEARNKDTHCVENFQTLNAELKIEPIILHVQSSHAEILSKITRHFRDFQYRYIIYSEEQLNFTENGLKIFSKLRDVERNNSKNTLEKITFSLQGRKSISLDKLLNLYPELSNQLRSCEVFEMVMETKVIGEVLPDREKPYVEREFDVTFLDEKIFTEIFNDVIVISGGKLNNEIFCEASELYRNSNWLLISYAEEGDVENVVTRIKEQMAPPVHYFKMLPSQKLVYVKSWGDVSNLEPYCRRETVKEENITCLCVGTTVNIISAEPGMGKTFLMDSLSYKFEWTKWIFNLKLNKIQHDLSNQLEEMCNDPAEFFFRHNKNVSKLDELVFQNFKTSKNVVFLIDGFDEICPMYEVATRRLIHKLRDDKYQVWITTRPMAHYMLEDTLGFPINLKAFSWRDSMELLTEWKCRADEVEQVLKKIDRNFITRPLHIKVIKDVVLLNEGNDDWNTYLTCDWYKVFIKKLLVMHYRINRNLDLRNNNAKYEMEESIKVVLKKHTFMALILLYGMNDVSKFIAEKKLRKSIEDVKHLNNNYGLIKDIVDDNPIFVQKTFAEYLTAQWLFDNRFKIINSSDNDKKEEMKVLYKKIYEKEFVQVRKLFNELTTKEFPLHRAVLQKKVTEVEANIKYVLKSDDLQRTPLHIAVEQLIDCCIGGRTTSTSILDFNDLRDRSQVWCSILEHLLKYCVKKDCIPQTKDVILNLDWLERANECHNLHVVASSNNSLILMNLLISSAADLEKDAKRGESFMQASRYGHLEIIKELHAHIDVTTKEKCLIIAASMGNLNVVKYLVEENTLNINTKNENNDTPLAIAIRRNHLNVVKYLTDKGADIHSSTVEGSCLVTAAFRGHLDIVRHLIECGADVNFRNMPEHNIYCKTPLIAATEFGYLQIVKELHENGAEVDFRSNCRYSPLFVACRENRVEIIKYLIGAKADVNLGCQYDDKPLIVAAAKGHYDVVQLILNKGGLVNIQNERQHTALHEAADNGHLSVVKLLIKEGADVKLTTATGATPLHFAAESGHVHVVEYLITLEADVNARNIGNYTPVHYAARCGHLDVIKLLVENEADVHVQTREGYTPLTLASSEGHLTVVEYLEKLP